MYAYIDIFRDRQTDRFAYINISKERGRNRQTDRRRGDCPDSTVTPT